MALLTATVVLLTSLVALSDDPSPPPALTTQPAAATSFAEGFAELAEQIGAVMGTPVEPEHAALDAEAVQRTTTGLAVWRKGQAPSFTDGWHTWSLETQSTLIAAEAPPPSNARVECIIAKESGNSNIANRRGSGAVGVAQYMPGTFAAHAREMGHPEWSPWNPAQARAVAAHDLALGRRGQWTVSGC